MGLFGLVLNCVRGVFVMALWSVATCAIVPSPKGFSLFVAWLQAIPAGGVMDEAWVGVCTVTGSLDADSGKPRAGSSL